MSSGGGTSTTTTTEQTGPWSPQQPYLLDAFAQARDQYYGANPITGPNGIQMPDPNATPQYFPGSTVAPLSPETQQALQLQADRGRAGSPLLSTAQSEAERTLAGDYLSAGNPYLSQLMQSINDTVRQQVDSRFAASSRYGSPAYSEATARALADAVAPYVFQNYTNERTNMARAASNAPALAQADYGDIAALANAGSQRDAQAQAQLQDQINRWNFNQNKDATRLARYLAMIQGNYGSTGTRSQVAQTPGTDPLTMALGAIFGGADAASKLGAKPFG